VNIQALVAWIFIYFSITKNFDANKRQQSQVFYFGTSALEIIKTEIIKIQFSIGYKFYF